MVDLATSLAVCTKGSGFAEMHPYHEEVRFFRVALILEGEHGRV